MAVTEYAPIVQTVSVLIDVSADDDLSSAADLHGLTLVALQCPATLTSTTITFSVSVNGTDYYTLNGVSATHAASEQIPLTPSEFAGVRYVKLITDGHEAADRTFNLVVRPV